MAKKGQKQRKYSAEFKLCVILDIHERGLGYREAIRKNWGSRTREEENSHFAQVKTWERIYKSEGAVGFMVERRRGRKPTGKPRPKPLPIQAESNLLEEVAQLRQRNQYLEMENEYLKKLDALVRAEEERNGKKPR